MMVMLLKVARNIGDDGDGGDNVGKCCERLFYQVSAAVLAQIVKWSYKLVIKYISIEAKRKKNIYHE